MGPMGKLEMVERERQREGVYPCTIALAKERARERERASCLAVPFPGLGAM